MPSVSYRTALACACHIDLSTHFAITLARLLALPTRHDIWRIAGCEELQADATADFAVHCCGDGCWGRNLRRLQVL